LLQAFYIVHLGMLPLDSSLSSCLNASIPSLGEYFSEPCTISSKLQNFHNLMKTKEFKTDM